MLNYLTIPTVATQVPLSRWVKQKRKVRRDLNLKEEAKRYTITRFVDNEVIIWVMAVTLKARKQKNTDSFTELLERNTICLELWLWSSGTYFRAKLFLKPREEIKIILLPILSCISLDFEMAFSPSSILPLPFETSMVCLFDNGF